MLASAFLAAFGGFFVTSTGNAQQSRAAEIRRAERIAGSAHGAVAAVEQGGIAVVTIVTGGAHTASFIHHAVHVTESDQRLLGVIESHNASLDAIDDEDACPRCTATTTCQTPCGRCEL